MDHLVPMLKDTLPDSKILNDMNLGRTKCTNIIKNCLAKTETQELVANLQRCKFSILVDESTDLGLNKVMCVLVKFIPEMSGVPQTQLLQLINLDAKDCSAASLYKSFCDCLRENNIPIGNVIGLACDTANVMIGGNNSFYSRLKEETDVLVLLKCICHSSALVASKACLELPRSPEELLRSISSYLSGSAKRSAILEEIQDFFQSECKRMLKLSSTRWLSLHQCVVRVLENWNALLMYFRLSAVEDKLKSAEFILSELENFGTKA